MSTRRLFLKQLGLAVTSLSVLPTSSEVEKILSNNYEGDPFWRVRELMKAQAKEDWEYHFLIEKGLGNPDGYTVALLQNGNIHRETWFGTFEKIHQENLFKRLMHGVNQFNSLPVEKQLEIREMMYNNRKMIV